MMKKRILAVLLGLALLSGAVPARAVESVSIFTKDGPVWLAMRGEEDAAVLVCSEDQGKTWSATSGFEGGAKFIQDIQYTGRDYFLTFFWCKMAYTSPDGRAWSMMPEREWFNENAGYITNGLGGGSYQFVWTGSEYMMRQGISGDPRSTHNMRGPNPRNRLVTLLDEEYNILGAVEFDGDVQSVRYQGGVYYATVGGVEHSFIRADWEYGDHMEHVAAAGGYLLRQVAQEDGSVRFDRAFDGHSWIKVEDLPWGSAAVADLQPSTGGDFAVRVGEKVYTSPDGLTWSVKTEAEYAAYLSALPPAEEWTDTEVRARREGDLPVGWRILVRQEGTDLLFSQDGVYWMQRAKIAEGLSLRGVWLLQQGALLELSDGSGLVAEPGVLYGIWENRFPYPRCYVTLDGDYLSFDDPPYGKNSRTMVPLRNISEALGFTVEYDDASVTCTKDDVVITVAFGTDDATVNGEHFTLDAGVELYHDRTYVPLRFFSEQMGLGVDWNGKTGTAALTTN